GNDSVSGGDGADTLVLEDGFGTDTLTGGEGGADNDLIDLSVVSVGATVTFTGNEAGTITDGTSTASFAETERLTLTELADSFDATADTAGTQVAAGAGDDTLTGGIGDDLLDGGDGADTFIVLDGFASDTILGGGARDTIDLSALSAPVTVTFNSDAAGTIDDGTSTLSFDGIEYLILSEGADLVDATADSLGTEIDALEGDDSVLGGSGADTVRAGDGNDTLDGAAGDDILSGDAGDDSLSGGAGDDALDGGSGSDTLLGSTGSDSLAGGLGNDSVSGGDGADTLVLEDGFGTDTLTGGEGG
ncbi:calcium-binding protein, partial [Cognatishimia sp. F0-27]|uniref:calcium-binding protein n=1 Tax=Cognatishimia sp. F0-27 TaxID=2816855 RepID=UPI001DDC5520